MTARTPDTRGCPTCGDALTFEILDDERFLVAWSCLNCGLIRTTEPV
jgi:rubredoxin